MENLEQKIPYGGYKMDGNVLRKEIGVNSLKTLDAEFKKAGFQKEEGRTYVSYTRTSKGEGRELINKIQKRRKTQDIQEAQNKEETKKGNSLNDILVSLAVAPLAIAACYGVRPDLGYHTIYLGLGTAILSVFGSRFFEDN